MSTWLNELGVACALGVGKDAMAEALFTGDRSRVRATSGWIPSREIPLAAVDGALPALPPTLAATRDNRNNRLLYAAALEIEAPIRAAIARYGSARIGVVIGTSTTGIDEACQGIARFRSDGAWPDDYRYAHQELGAPAEFLAEWLELGGPCFGISTACTSGARALLSARRLLRMGVCDAVLCGGADTLAGLPINGFFALEALDANGCRPFARTRGGITIGEAAALFLVTREPGPVALLGGGASSDAYHMSSPDPQGLGAVEAMRAALADAGVVPEQIDYVNLHGTGTEHNDAMESLAMTTLFPHGVPCSSTKSLTGHTLGAAGALEAAFCWLALRDGRLPPHAWDGDADPALPPLRFAAIGDRLPTAGRRRLLSSSFAFGGNNAALVLGDGA